MEHWKAWAIYADGSEVICNFPYSANGNYVLEREEQYVIECWLLERDGPPAVWFSVDYVSDEDKEE